MQTKLTLRLEDTLIRQAKRFARRSGRSLSGIVGDLFTLLEEEKEVRARALPPVVRSLRGALSGARSGEEEYRRHLARKHR